MLQNFRTAQIEIHSARRAAGRLPPNYRRGLDDARALSCGEASGPVGTHILLHWPLKSNEATEEKDFNFVFYCKRIHIGLLFQFHMLV